MLERGRQVRRLIRRRLIGREIDKDKIDGRQPMMEIDRETANGEIEISHLNTRF
jgi:hypothetical protein